MNTATLPRPVRYPPEHRTWHPLGRLPELQRNPLEAIGAAHRACGDTVRMRVGNLYLASFLDPAAVEHILLKHTQDFAKDTRGYQKLRLIFGNGLVTSQGSFWKRQRRIAQPAFHRRCLQRFVEVMDRASADMVNQLSYGHRDLDLAAEMNRVTLRIVGETLFSMDVSSDAEVVKHTLEYALEHFRRITASPLPFHERLPTYRNWKWNRTIAKMDELVHGIIERRRREPGEYHDLLGMFMASIDDETGESMTNSQLRDEVLTMLMAGHETTANAVTWALYELMRAPHHLERMAEEAEAVLADGPLTMESTKRLVFTRQVLDETMRMHPPVWCLARRAKTDTEVLGYQVNKGDHVFISQYHVHRNPQYWLNPHRFDPERFSPQALADRKAKGFPRAAYFPFSMGSRQCIGDRFALLEGVIILAYVAGRLSLQPLRSTPAQSEPSITLRMIDGLPAQVGPRV